MDLFTRLLRTQPALSAPAIASDGACEGPGPGRAIGDADLLAVGPAHGLAGGTDSGRASRRRWSLDDPASRRRAALHYHLADHAILRHHWTNLDQVSPEVWRSNHPTHSRLEGLKAMGIRTILNLRGAGRTTPFLFESESCNALGLALVSVGLAARKPPRKGEVLALFEAFRTVERPFLMHCKSGADRAGFASALFLLANGAPMRTARRQLSLRYLHVRASRTGVLDRILDLYEGHAARVPIGIEDWFRHEYDPAAPGLAR